MVSPEPAQRTLRVLKNRLQASKLSAIIMITPRSLRLARCTRGPSLRSTLSLWYREG